MNCQEKVATETQSREAALVQIANGRPKVHLGVPLRATPGYSQVAAMRLRVKRMPLPILIPASAFLADDRRLPFVAGDLDADDLVRMVSRRRVQKCSQARQLSRILNRFTGTRRNDRFFATTAAGSTSAQVHSVHPTASLSRRGLSDRWWRPKGSEPF